MTEAEIKFERENRDGVVAVGTYLFDAARRLGIEVEAECGRIGECDSCEMRITHGIEFLSEPTGAEIKQLSASRRRNRERLSCQVKFEKSGEVVAMTNKKKKEEKPKDEEMAEEYRKQFEEFPLEKKIASLVQLEAIALGETFSFILNSPSAVLGKMMDVLAQFGLKMDADAKNATRPNEHKENTKKTNVDDSQTKSSKDQPDSKNSDTAEV
ncbi:MAG: 2Fe-2S iron-sulfur cluster binding domain-containing protein [Pyrinomonadaceae bacterium]